MTADDIPSVGPSPVDETAAVDASYAVGRAEFAPVIYDALAVERTMPTLGQGGATDSPQDERTETTIFPSLQQHIAAAMRHAKGAQVTSGSLSERIAQAAQSTEQFVQSDAGHKAIQDYLHMRFYDGRLTGDAVAMRMIEDHAQRMEIKGGAEALLSQIFNSVENTDQFLHDYASHVQANYAEIQAQVQAVRDTRFNTDVRAAMQELEAEFEAWRNEGVLSPARQERIYELMGTVKDVTPYALGGAFILGAAFYAANPEIQEQANHLFQKLSHDMQKRWADDPRKALSDSNKGQNLFNALRSHFSEVTPEIMVIGDILREPLNVLMSSTGLDDLIQDATDGLGELAKDATFAAITVGGAVDVVKFLDWVEEKTGQSLPNKDALLKRAKCKDCPDKIPLSQLQKFMNAADVDVLRAELQALDELHLADDRSMGERFNIAYAGIKANVMTGLHSMIGTDKLLATTVRDESRAPVTSFLQNVMGLISSAEAENRQAPTQVTENSALDGSVIASSAQTHADVTPDNILTPDISAQPAQQKAHMPAA